MLPTPFRPEGSALPVKLPNGFERFYRGNLRRVNGSRLRSAKIHEVYSTWASEHGEASLTYSALRKLMEAVGHRRIQSNGVSYLDVGFASDFPTIGDALTLAPGGLIVGTAPTSDADAQLIARVDAALAALLELRHDLIARGERQDPAAAAGRILGLFDR